MNIKVILQVAYMSAFRPSFCLNGSFARVFKIFRHRQTDRHTDTHTHGTDHSTPAQARGNEYNTSYALFCCYRIWPFQRLSHSTVTPRMREATFTAAGVDEAHTHKFEFAIIIQPQLIIFA